MLRHKLLFFASSRFNFVEELRESDIRVMSIHLFYLLLYRITFYRLELNSINVEYETDHSIFNQKSRKMAFFNKKKDYKLKYFSFCFAKYKILYIFAIENKIFIENSFTGNNHKSGCFIL